MLLDRLIYEMGKSTGGIKNVFRLIVIVDQIINKSSTYLISEKISIDSC